MAIFVAFATGIEQGIQVGGECTWCYKLKWSLYNPLNRSIFNFNLETGGLRPCLGEIGAEDV